MWKDYFYFTKRERTGIYVLIALIVIVISTDLLVSRKISPQTGSLSEENKKEYSGFIASIKEEENAWKNRYLPFHKDKTTSILFPFDPNLADSATFIRLGIRPYIARNILRYRAKGGKFRTPEAFSKIYGITPVQFSTLLPYIRISEEFRIKRDSFFISTLKDTLKVFKYPAGTIVDLNSADTSELKKIPGISSGIARMIVGYRSRLGGFYQTEQLQEIKYIPAELNKWFGITAASIRRINLNKASIERLNAHPYINFYQAKVIVEFRKKKGALKALSQLSLYEEFTKEDLDRLSHYIEF